MIKIISSGSDGNCVLYGDSIAIDIGINFKKISPYLNNLKWIFLTHEHSDHFNGLTLVRINFKFPKIKIITNDFMKGKIDDYDIKNVTYIKSNQWYRLNKSIKIASFDLVHDVPNIGYRIVVDGYKIFHATDTGSLDGIEARDYDLYAIESNYDTVTLNEKIAYNEENNLFNYQKYVEKRHLSNDQCDKFFEENKKNESKLVRLHISKNNNKEVFYND